MAYRYNLIVVLLLTDVLFNISAKGKGMQEKAADGNDQNICDPATRWHSLRRLLGLFQHLKHIVVLVEKNDCAMQTADLLVHHKLKEFATLTIYSVDSYGYTFVNETLQMLLTLPKKVQKKANIATILWLCSWSHTVRYFVVIQSSKKWRSIAMSRYRHLVFTPSQEAPDLRETLPNVFVEGLQMYVLVRIEEDYARQASSQVVSQKEILLFVSSNATGSLMIKRCLWNETMTSLSRFCKPSIEEVYRNFNGRILTVCSVKDLPYSDIEDVGNKTLIWNYSLDQKIIETLAEHLNFSIFTAIPAHIRSGHSYYKNTWSNLIKIISERKADLAIGYISMTPKRKKLVDFSRPYFSEDTVVVSPAPQQLSRTFIVYKPFTANVWLAVFSASIAASVILCIFSSPGQSPKSRQGQPGRRVLMGWLFGESLWFVFTTIVNQVPQRSNALPAHSRLVLLFWCLFILMVAACYRGTLTSYMTFPLKDSPIENLRQLRDKMDTDGYQWFVPDGSNYVDLFKEAQDGVLYELRSKMAEDSFVSPFVSASENIKIVATTPKATLLCGRKVAEYEASVVGRQKLHIGKHGFALQQYAIALQKDAPYRQLIDVTIARMAEAGFIEHWLRSIIDQAQKSNSVATDNNHSLKRIKLDDVQGAFLLLVLGFFFAGFVFFAELYVRKKRANTSTSLKGHQTYFETSDFNTRHMNPKHSA